MTNTYNDDTFMVIEIDNTTIFGHKDSKEKYKIGIKVDKDYDIIITFMFEDDLTINNWQCDFFMHWETDKHYVKGNGTHWRGIGEHNQVKEDEDYISHSTDRIH